KILRTRGKAYDGDAHICSFVYPLFIAPRIVDLAVGDDALQDFSIGSAANGVCGNKADALNLLCYKPLVCLRDPITNNTAATGNLVSINIAQSLRIFVSFFFADLTSTEKRR